MSTDVAVDAIEDQEGRVFWDQCSTIQEIYTTNSNKDVENNGICVNSNEGEDIDCQILPTLFKDAIVISHFLI